METTNKPEEFCFVASKPCGCLVLIIADVKEMKKEIQNKIPEMFRLGYEIKRIPVEQVRTMKSKCVDHRINQENLFQE